MPTASVPISAIVICKNEAANIGRCLAGLVWAHEVVVVDSGSTDGTIDIVSGFANARLITSEWLGYSRTKQLAVSHTRNAWVLWVDADEAVTPALQAALQAWQPPADVSAADMPRRTYFMGTWVRHTGWYPGRVARLFHKERCAFNDNILHEGIELKQGKLAHLDADLEHYSYQTLYQYFDKMNAYGRAGALELQRKGKRFGLHLLVLSPLAAFFKFYFLKAGYKDGAVGLIISVGSAFSHFIKYVNYFYLLNEKSS